MTLVKKWIRNICNDVLGNCPVKIGQRWIIRDRLCQITNGQYWGERGISNFWYWKEVNKDGSLGKEHSGYADWFNWKKVD